MDFLELYRRYGCTLQTGGSDQWGNLLAGTELVHKAEGVTVHALATPLVTKADGAKFGKTEGGSIWLDAEMTSPYAFYQFWVNSDDAEVIQFLKYFTFRSREEIDALTKAVADEPHKREAQRTLAYDVTALVHGVAATDAVVAASQAIFGLGELSGLDAGTLAGVATEAPSAEIAAGTPMVDAMVTVGLVESRSAGRRAVAEGGAYLNNENVSDPDLTLDAGAALAGGWAVLRRGKKTIGLVRILK